MLSSPSPQEMEQAQPLLVAQKPKQPEKKQRRTIFRKKKEIDNTASTPYIDADKPRPALSADEEKLLSCIGADSMLVDDVISASDLSAGQVLAMLTMLEIKGVITRLPGKRIVKK